MNLLYRILLPGFLILLVSCTFTKRLYTGGYYIESNAKGINRKPEIKWSNHPIVLIPQNINASFSHDTSEFIRNTTRNGLIVIKNIRVNKTQNYFSLKPINGKSLIRAFDNKKINKISAISVNIVASETKPEKEEQKPNGNQLSGLSLLCGIISCLFGLTGFLGSLFLFFEYALSILSNLSIFIVIASILISIGTAVLSLYLSYRVHFLSKNKDNYIKMGNAATGVALSEIGLILSAIGLLFFLAVV